MSVEQMVLVLFLIVVPLFQALGALRRRRAAQGSATDPTDPRASEQEAHTWEAPTAEQHTWEAPTAEQHTWEAPTAEQPVSSLPLQRPIPSKSTRPSSKHSRRPPPQHPLPLRASRILPKGRAGLRDALTLMAILGPPRALDPAERDV
jgi:hypothetical protein